MQQQQGAISWQTSTVITCVTSRGLAVLPADHYQLTAHSQLSAAAQCQPASRALMAAHQQTMRIEIRATTPPAKPHTQSLRRSPHSRQAQWRHDSSDVMNDDVTSLSFSICEQSRRPARRITDRPGYLRALSGCRGRPATDAIVHRDMTSSLSSSDKT